MAFDTFFDLMHEKGESQLDFCERFGWLEDVRANNFIGTKSLEENLRFVPRDIAVGPLRKSGREHILAGLEDALPQAHLSAIWSIIWLRWQHWCSLRDGGGPS